MTSEKTNYQELLNSSKWMSKRKTILVRDGYRCRNCNCSTGLQVHHRQYHVNRNGQMVDPWSYSGKYLITLCNECHSKGHKSYKVPIFKIK